MFKRVVVSIMFTASLCAPALRGQNPGAIRGRVVDAVTGKPLAGAAALLWPQGNGVATNHAGEFKIVPAGRSDSLVVRYLGYQPVRLAVTALSENAKIALQPAYLHFHEVTVTAKREAAMPADIPAPVEAVAVDAPRLITKQNVGEAISRMQSLFIKEYGGLSGLKTVTMRGASEGQVLVLQDGFRLNNPQGGWVDFNLMPTLGVESIEVMRGGASAQYGSEAVGGIVHVRTLAPPAHFSPQAEYTVGSYGMGSARVKLGQRFGRFSGVAAYGQLRTDGDYPTGLSDQSTLQNNSLDKRDFYVRAGYDFSQNLRVSAFHQIVKSDREVAGSLSFPSPHATQVDDSRMTALLFNAERGELIDLTLQGGVQHFDETYDNPDPFFPVASRHRVDSREVLLHNRSRTGNLDLLYGAELAYHEINSTDINKPERDQRSAFAQAEWRVQRVRKNTLISLALIPALRFDDYSDAGSRTTPKFSAVWKLERNFSLSLHGSAGKSFRVPSMNDLYWPSGPYTAGNPNLRPEEGEQYDGGFLLQTAGRSGSWQIGCDVFRMELRNLIAWIPDENFRFSPQNIASAKISGLEPSLTWRAVNDHFNLRLGYTKLNAKDDGDDPAARGKKLLYRPEHKLDAILSAQVFDVTLGAAYQLVSERYVRQDNSLSLPGYSLVELFGKYRFSFAGGYQVYLASAVSNLFDKNIQVIEGYPAPGREFRLTLGVGR
jgi:outer membrane cobalamin receptor